MPAELCARADSGQHCQQDIHDIRWRQAPVSFVQAFEFPSDRDIGNVDHAFDRL